MTIKHYDPQVKIPWGYCWKCGETTFNQLTDLSGQTDFMCLTCLKHIEEGFKMANGFDRGYHHTQED